MSNWKKKTKQKPPKTWTIFARGERLEFKVEMINIRQCCCDTKTVLMLSVKYGNLLPEEHTVKMQSGMSAILISAAL